MGKNVLRLLKFAIRYPTWHSYGVDRSTRDALKSLESYGLIEVNRTNRQFRLANFDVNGDYAKIARERKTITRDELSRLSVCNSKNLPSPVEFEGQRLQWVGIGWVNEGEPTGEETLVVD